MKKVLITIALTSVIGFYAIYYNARPNFKAQEEKILESFKQDNSSLADALLNNAHGQKLPRPNSFYKGCLAQIKGKHQESDLLFHAALKQPADDKEGMTQDILFALMTNAFFEMHDDRFLVLLNKAREEASFHPLLPFFEGLSSYLSFDFKYATHLWQPFSDSELHQAGKWASSCFDCSFSLNWRRIHFAHCLIETGNIEKGREILEKEIRLCPKNEPHATLFLGLTYLKEAQKISPDQRDSYYQLALFYFDKSGLIKGREREKIAEHLENEADFLITRGTLPLQKKQGLECVFTLQEWGMNKAIDRLSNQVASCIIANKDTELLQLLQDKFHGSHFYLLTTQNIFNELSKSLKRGDSQDLLEKWTLLESIVGSNKELLRHLTALASREIFESIKNDDPSLKMTLCILNFWEKFDHSPYEKEQLAKELFIASRLLWQNDGQETKALKLMDTAYKMYSPIVSEIEVYLNSLYAEAENSNMIRRLTLIYDALEHFGLNQKEWAAPCKIANYLADAEYLYFTRNYYSAKIHASWVLKLDPVNESAIRLIGLSCFHLGEYNKARSALARLSHPDEYVCKALILSQVYCSEAEGKHLVQIDNLDSFNADE